MVEGTPLLRVQTGNRLEGSNPFVSAMARLFQKTFEYQAIALVRCLASTHVSPTRFPHKGQSDRSLPWVVVNRISDSSFTCHQL